MGRVRISDRGMASRETYHGFAAQWRYIIGAPKSELKKFSACAS